MEYSGSPVPSIRRENIKDAPKRAEIPGALLCGSFKVAAGKGRGGAAKGRGWQWLQAQDPITGLFPYLAT